MRQQQCKGRAAEDRKPDDPSPPQAIAERSTDQGAGSDREQEHREQLGGRARRYAEMVNQVEGVEAADAHQIEELRKHQYQQDADGAAYEPGRKSCSSGCEVCFCTLVGALLEMRPIPATHLQQDHDGEQGEKSEPGDVRTALRAVPQYQKGREQRPERLPDVAADLEDRLGESVAAARRQARHARGFGMEGRGAAADQPDRKHHQGITGRHGEQQQAAQRKAHADRQESRKRMPVGDRANHRLEQRSCELEGERDRADLEEPEIELSLEQRVERQDHRLHDVVQRMRRADPGESAPTAQCATGYDFSHEMKAQRIGASVAPVPGGERSYQARSRASSSRVSSPSDQAMRRASSSKSAGGARRYSLSM